MYRVQHLKRRSFTGAIFFCEQKRIVENLLRWYAKAMGNQYDGHEQATFQPDDAWGDILPNLENIPAVISVQDAPRPDRLVEDAKAYLDEHPELREWAIREKYQAFVHNRLLYIGGGLTAFALSIGAIAIVLHKHHTRK